MELAYSLIALAACISVHEASHAWIAWKLGDPTAKMEGRVSLNPLRHLDLLGTLMIFVAHFGWGKPVPFDERNLKHPLRDSALIAVAGPLSNLLMAMAAAFALKYWPMPEFPHRALQSIYSLSLVLLLFNLLPIAPLDGSKFIGILIPRSAQPAYQRFLAQGPIWLIGLVLGDRLVEVLSGFSFLESYLRWGFALLTLGIHLVLR